VDESDITIVLSSISISLTQRFDSSGRRVSVSIISLPPLLEFPNYISLFILIVKVSFHINCVGTIFIIPLTEGADWREKAKGVVNIPEGVRGEQ